MRVLFIARSTLNTVRGGDTTQVYRTADSLRSMGVEVDIKLAGETADVNAYDVVHLFNIIRPADHLHYLRNCRTPVAISTIYVDYSHYDLNERKGAGGWVAKRVNKYQLEYLKTIGRAILGQDELVSTSYLLGHRRGIMKLAERADVLLPNSENEAKRFFSDMGRIFPYAVIPNGVDPDVAEYQPKGSRNMRQVICVAQIEGRKNQHMLIEATRGMDIDLLLVGKPSPNNISYEKYCKRIAHDRVRFTGYIYKEALFELFHTSAVHALPSWFETTGLSTLEAATAGCQLVVSDEGDTRDYFEGYAAFCHPNDLNSIREALNLALSGNLPPMKQKVLENYTWDQAARATLEAYKNIL